MYVNDDLEDLIGIALKADPSAAEYYLRRYLRAIRTTEMKAISDEIDYLERHYDDDDDCASEGIIEMLSKKEKRMKSELARLEMLITSTKVA